MSLMSRFVVVCTESSQRYHQYRSIFSFPSTFFWDQPNILVLKPSSSIKQRRRKERLCSLTGKFFRDAAKLNFIKPHLLNTLSSKFFQRQQHGYPKPVSRYSLVQCFYCLLNEDWDHVGLWHMLNYFTEVRFQISFYVNIRTCLLVWNCLCWLNFAIAVL